MWMKNRYEKLSKLGEGTYGTVFKAVDHSPQLQQPFAVSFEVPLGSTSAALSDPKVLVTMSSTLKSLSILAGAAKKPGKGEEAKEAGSYVALKKLTLFEVRSEQSSRRGVEHGAQATRLFARN